jgi:predicted nicotinamide N-methyase
LLPKDIRAIHESRKEARFCATGGAGRERPCSPERSRLLEKKALAGQARAAGRLWRIARPADLETLWEKIASEEDASENFSQDERLPYWVQLWPASLALADWLAENRGRIAGRRCLELGCGLGLTALAASSLNAGVVAVDYEEEALHYARMNAALNGVREPLWAVMDWRVPAVLSRSFEVIWGSDILYERRFASPVLDFLEYALAPGGLVWLADPGRNVYADFMEQLSRRGWKASKVRCCRVKALYGRKEPVHVDLWELS